MHEDFSAWGADHAERYPKITLVDYDPVAHPEQRIDVAKTPAMINRHFSDPSVIGIWETLRKKVAKEKNIAEEKVPEDDLVREYRSTILEEFDSQYAELIGGWQKARVFIESFRTEIVDTEEQATASDVIVSRLEEKETVGIVMDHAEDLFDFAKILGGLSLAVARDHKYKYMGSFSGWVNKLMTREEYAGIYIPDLIAWGGSVRWTIPSTENAAKYVVNPEVAGAVNKAALKSFMEDSKRAGTVEVLVPSGSATKKRADDKGEVFLSVPPIPDSSANLLSKFNVLIPCSTWAGRLTVGKMIEVAEHVPRGKKDREAKQKLAQMIRETLRAQTQELSNLPVVFEEDLED